MNHIGLFRIQDVIIVISAAYGAHTGYVNPPVVAAAILYGVVENGPVGLTIAIKSMLSLFNNNPITAVHGLEIFLAEDPSFL